MTEMTLKEIPTHDTTYEKNLGTGPTLNRKHYITTIMKATIFKAWTI